MIRNYTQQPNNYTNYIEYIVHYSDNVNISWVRLIIYMESLVLSAIIYIYLYKYSPLNYTNKVTVADVLQSKVN